MDCPPEFMSRETRADGSVVTTNHETYGYEVYVAPKDRSKQKSLISTAKMSDSDGVELQTYMVEMQKVKLSVPASHNSFFNVLYVVSIITSVVALIVIVWILCLVFKLVRSIRKGDIFVTQVSKYLEITGILLSALYLYQTIIDFAITQYLKHHIQLADYFIVGKDEANDMYLLTGLALMIISQIILMGKDLKDEQELTI
ncbi:MAG: DUF2975 domain-containing protein [Prevotella sp.]|nr:DUF2975 domain-containing protein [Prevotella sp.]